MDRQLRQEIVAEFGRCMQGLQERYVTAETLSQHVETLTPEWLKRYGSCFNRTRVEWDDERGHHTQGWLYPLNEIKQMLLDGRIKQLKADNMSKV